MRIDIRNLYIQKEAFIIIFKPSAPFTQTQMPPRASVKQPAAVVIILLSVMSFPSILDVVKR